MFPLDFAWLGSTQLDSAYLSLTQLDSARLSWSQHDLAWLSAIQLNSARLKRNKQFCTQLGSAWLSSAWLDLAHGQRTYSILQTKHARNSVPKCPCKLLQPADLPMACSSSLEGHFGTGLHAHFPQLGIMLNVVKTIWSAVENYIDCLSIKFGWGLIRNISQKIDFEQEMWVYVQENHKNYSSRSLHWSRKGL